MRANRIKAKVLLEDGRIFEGLVFSRSGEKYGEVVFNTNMTGYQEIITDPSYKGQIVAMTYPMIGNYGINLQDMESRRPFLEGFIIKELSRVASNWRAQKSLEEYLNGNGVLGVEGVDTRALTRHIRSVGAMRAVISTEDMDNESLIRKVNSSPELIGTDLVREVSCTNGYIWNMQGKYKVVVLDCGVKYNILRMLSEYGCAVYVMPAFTSVEAIMSSRPDGILLSNGPGDPAAVPYVVDTVRNLLGKIPIFGICLGHQFLGLALGGRTYKLKFGHRGANHPVKDLNTGKISITAQNHGFCVDIGSLDEKEVEVTHINLNDNTIEGMRMRKIPAFSVQFHPEASAGPHDTNYLFKQFIKLMES